MNLKRIFFIFLAIICLFKIFEIWQERMALTIFGKRTNAKIIEASEERNPCPQSSRYQWCYKANLDVEFANSNSEIMRATIVEEKMGSSTHLFYFDFQKYKKGNSIPVIYDKNNSSKVIESFVLDTWLIFLSFVALFVMMIWLAFYWKPISKNI